MMDNQDTLPHAGIPTLFSVALAVARIETLMAEREATREEREEQLLRSVKQAVAEALAPTSARVDALQKKADRALWLSTGGSAVVAAAWWLYKNFGKAAGFVLIGALLGCASVPVAGDAPGPGLHWCPQERPAHVIVADALPNECVLAVADAVDFWRAHGVSYLTLAVVPDASLKLGEVIPRFIKVANQPPEDPGATGETRVNRVTEDCMQASELRLQPEYACAPGANTVAHELGHALGLDHVTNDPQNLMWPANLPNGFALTPEQLVQVR